MTNVMRQILPDCMMPDGADPCRGYQQLRDRAERAEASCDRLRVLLWGVRDYVGWDRLRQRIDDALTEDGK